MSAIAIPTRKFSEKWKRCILKSQGLSHQQIQQLCRIRSRTTLANYLREYEAGGIEALKQLH